MNAAGQIEQPLPAQDFQGQIKIQTSEKIGTIDQDIYGLFIPMVIHEFEAGLWAEMLRSRKFYGDDGGGENYGVVEPWFAIGRNEKTHFAHDNTIYYCGRQSQKIISEEPANRRTGVGQGKLCFEKGKVYQVRLNLKQKGIAGAVTVALEGKDGVYAGKEIVIPDTDWRRFSFNLESNQTDGDGKFTITFSGDGTLWVGSGSLMPADNVSGFRADVLEALKAIKPPHLRWPGGCNAEDYTWQEGIGDMDKRPPHFNKGFFGEWKSNDVGIDEFMELCRLTGAKPYINVNFGTASPEEAANWVQYCNGGADTKYGKLRAENGHTEPYNVKIWGIGNEIYGNWQLGHIDEETYAKKYVEFAKAMRAVDKDIKLVIAGGRYWKYPGWNQALFKTAGEYIDYLSLHSYAKKYRSKLKKEDLKDPKLALETYYYIVSSPYGLEEQLIETGKEIKKALPDREDLKIAFDEWNAMLYKIPSREIDYALREGLYTAGVLHAFRRQLDVATLANFATPVNVIPMIRVNSCGMFLNPQYLAFEMYLNHSGTVLLSSDVKCGTFDAPEYEEGRPQAKGQIPYLDVSATESKDGRTVYAAVINLHSNKSIDARIVFDRWDFSPAVKTFELYDEDFTAENTFENPGRLTIKAGILDDVKNPFEYNFKPHSVTIMEFQR
jgi:alpha-N-arabinofuranosidase